MSIYAYAYVWETKKFKGAELLMMLALADFAHQDTGECYPSIPTLAKMLRVTDRNIQILLRRLEKNGTISIVERKGVHTDSGSTNRYTILGYCEWKQGVKDFSSLKNQEVKVSTSRGESLSTQEVKVSSPKPLVEPSLEPKSTRKSATPPTLHPLIQAWATIRGIDAVNIGAPIYSAKDLTLAKKMAKWDSPPTTDEICAAVKASKVTSYPFMWLESDIPKLRLLATSKATLVIDPNKPLTESEYVLQQIREQQEKEAALYGRAS